MNPPTLIVNNVSKDLTGFKIFNAITITAEAKQYSKSFFNGNLNGIVFIEIK